MSTKTTLLDHAETLARSRGFDAFSYADLAAAIGIRKASIHHHFPSKADLALALMTRYREGFAARLAGITTPDAAETLRAYVALYRAALGKGDRLCLCVAFGIGRDSFDEQTLGQINGFHHDSLIWLAGLFSRGQRDGTFDGADPEGAAHACLALVEGAQIMARAAHDVALFDRATAQLVKG